MRLRTAYQRRRLALELARAAGVPDVVRDKGDAEQQMRFFDQLGPRARLAIAQSRFDDDAIARWRDGYVGEFKDPDLAQRVQRLDDGRAGTFGPPAPGGI